MGPTALKSLGYAHRVSHHASEGRAYGLRLSPCGCLVTWLVGDRRGSVLPTPQTLLRSVYAGRLCVAIAIYLSAAVKFAVAGPVGGVRAAFVAGAAGGGGEGPPLGYPP